MDTVLTTLLSTTLAVVIFPALIYKFNQYRKKFVEDELLKFALKRMFQIYLSVFISGALITYALFIFINFIETQRLIYLINTIVIITVSLFGLFFSIITLIFDGTDISKKQVAINGLRIEAKLNGITSLTDDEIDKLVNDKITIEQIKLDRLAKTNAQKEKVAILWNQLLDTLNEADNLSDSDIKEILQSAP